MIANCARPSYWRHTLQIYFIRLLSNYSIKSLDVLYIDRPYLGLTTVKISKDLIE